MINMFIFQPRKNSEAIDNLFEFIALCKNNLTAFDSHLPFDEIKWDVTDVMERRGQYSNRRLVFSNWETCNSDSISPMAEPFLSFAKAYTRYKFSLRPHKGFAADITALRALEAALINTSSTADPTRTNVAALNGAAQLLRDRLSGGVAYCAGMRLQRIAKFLSDHRIATGLTHWKNPIARTDFPNRIGREFDAIRNARLPSHRALTAMPEAFALATAPVDVLVSSIIALLCSAPDRVGEVLSLSADCEVSGQADDGSEAYGLRWLPEKGGRPMIKWIVPSMAGIVKTAVSKIRALTQRGRDIATWYESNPLKLYLPPHLEPLRQKTLLSMKEVAWILFEDANSNDRPERGALQWCRINKVPTQKDERRLFVSFELLEKAIVNLLPSGFPIAAKSIGLRYSKMLFITHRGFASPSRQDFNCAIEPFDYNRVRDGLGARSRHGVASMFDRLQLTEDDGSNIRVSTHQFRHYLNTLAQAGGMSQLDIAKWSGRKSIRQNKYYDHVPARAIIDTIRLAIGKDPMIYGNLSVQQNPAPTRREEFAKLVVPTAHTTDFGYCIHDYTMTPCQLHRDCINCPDLVCVKGNAAGESNLRQRQKETRDLLAKAKHASSELFVGATRWVEHHTASLARIDALCRILDDENVPTGACIQLARDGNNRSQEILPSTTLAIQACSSSLEATG